MKIWYCLDVHAHVEARDIDDARRKIGQFLVDLANADDEEAVCEAPEHDGIAIARMNLKPLEALQ